MAKAEDRYLARLFALRYTDCSRLSVYANTNNVNENRKPGRDGDWDPANQPEGSNTKKMVGLRLLFMITLPVWKLPLRFRRQMPIRHLLRLFSRRRSIMPSILNQTEAS